MVQPAKRTYIYSLLAAVILLTTGVSYLSAQPSEQYKKHNRDAIAAIVDGDYEKAIESLKKQLSDYEQNFVHHHHRYPVDMEALFGLAVAYAQKGEMTEAMRFVNKAIDCGLPVERFLTGPRKLLQPIIDYPEFQSFLQQQNIRLLHGPMLSDVTDTQAEFWIRTVEEVPVVLKVSKSPNLQPLTGSDTVITRESRDFTAVLQVTNLQPGTQYYYQLSVDGEPSQDLWKFTTFPVTGQPTRFHIGFGGGAGFTPWFEYMWNTVADHEPLAFLLLGDNVYIDHPTYPEVQRYCYYRRQSRPGYRNFTAQSSIYAIWDDHDFTTNDGWGGPKVDEPPWKRAVWNVFRQNWNNPAYGGGKTHPGCWFPFAIGDVDFFMLDGRYYREDPAVQNPSMLGPVQKQWLFDQLQQSGATFKVIASPVPWARGTKPGSPDTWDGYQEERAEIFSFLAGNNIEGVVLLSADRHRSDVWRIDREEGYPLYEFESSKLTNVHTHQMMPDALLSYNEKCSFGKLIFNTTRDDPTVSYEIYSIDNELIHKITLTRSQLSGE